MQQRSIPIYALYGEFLSGARSEIVHHETLRERSIKHDWDIKLHRHEALVQVFSFQTPNVFLRVGDIDFQTTGPTVLLVPLMTVHGFQLPKDVVGDVLSFPVALKGGEDELRAPVIVDSEAPDELKRLTQIVEQTCLAFAALGPEREAVLTHLKALLFLYFKSSAQLFEQAKLSSNDSDMTRDEQQALAFCAQIEKSFAAALTVDDYADALDVSPSHLTRISNRILNASPNALITKRRMLEAERLLRFTRNPVAEVAIRSGYPDSPYFNRVFKRHKGLTPGAFRKQCALPEFAKG